MTGGVLFLLQRWGTKVPWISLEPQGKCFYTTGMLGSTEVHEDRRKCKWLNDDKGKSIKSETEMEIPMDLVTLAMVPKEDMKRLNLQAKTNNR